ncbi:MAG: right-handed parallel beta-helix repeat-containing protein [Proteobacteria bacterium]|nr:right-handed parallel beta-helix repeat-containing protein [Cystobacterineae bacterium]MCL2314771.1 right-handed parallel beta-helix repeat-containing protein [Pseudomonadota bacterium]
MKISIQSRFGRALYEALPEVYRTRDTQEREEGGGEGHLAAYLDSCGRLLDAIYSSLGQRYKDCFPEECQEWLLPYFAELLSASTLSPHAEGRRKEIMHAVAWRQGKGSLKTIAQIAEKIGEFKKLVMQEGWQRLARTARVGGSFVSPTLVDLRGKNPQNFVGHHNKAVHSVDVRQPTWCQGHANPRSILLYAAPYPGFFTEKVVRFEWEPNRAGDLENIDSWFRRGGGPVLSDFIGTSLKNNTRHFFKKPERPETICLTGIKLEEAGRYHFTELNVDDELSVPSQTHLTLEKLAAHTITVDENSEFIARDCLLHTLNAPDCYVQLEYCTVLGELFAEYLEASDCIFMGRLYCDESKNKPPRGGIRYSRYVQETTYGSVAHTLSFQGLTVANGGVSFSALSNLNVTAYWAVLSSDEPAPSAHEIMTLAKEKGNTGRMRRKETFFRTLPRPSVNTACQFYFVVDSGGNTYSEVWSAAMPETIIHPGPPLHPDFMLQTVDGVSNSLAPSGSNTGNSNSLSYNSVTLLEEGRVGDVYGAIHLDGSKVVSNNRLFIHGEVQGDVFGGVAETEADCSNTATVSHNSVHFNNATVKNGTVYGGLATSSSEAATVSNNNITIDNSTIGCAYGGHIYNDSGTATATGNNITLCNGRLEEIYGAYVDSSSGAATAAGNSITIYGGEVGVEIWGVHVSTSNPSEGVSVIGNNLTISGGTIGGGIYGAYAANNHGPSIISGNNLTISGGTINDSIFCVIVETRNTFVTDNTVNISGSPVFGEHTELHAGDDYENGIFSGNTLNLHSADISIAELSGFQNLNFHLPTTLAVNGTMLTVTRTADIGSNSTISVSFESAGRILQPKDRFILINAGMLTGTFEPTSGTTDGHPYTLERDSNSLVLVIGEEVTENTNSESNSESGSELGLESDADGSPWTQTAYTAQDLKRLEDMSVFFVHNSVGANILEGLKQLVFGGNLFITSGSQPSAKGIVEFYMATNGMGLNGRPLEKLEAFEELMDGGGNKAQIAFMKFCYADFDAHTNVEELFSAYVSTLSALEDKYENVTFVHVTVPLYPYESSVDNSVQHAFNEKLRTQYRALVFDLAAIEAVDASGEAVFARDHVSPALAEDWAFASVGQGGHLSTTGGMHVARGLISFLAQVPLKTTLTIHSPCPMVSEDGEETHELSQVFLERIAGNSADKPEFYTTEWGKPGCGVIHPVSPESIGNGAEDGGEMGAFHHRAYVLAWQAVALKLLDYLPVGMSAALIPDETLSEKEPM